MKRTWDESKSPQWRYLLGKESETRKKAEKLFRESTGEGEVKRNKPGSSKRRTSSQKVLANNNAMMTKEKQFTKQGKEILYSASPGHSNKIQKNTNYNDTTTIT